MAPLQTGNLSGLGDYLALYQKLKTKNLDCAKQIRIALLSSFTISGLKEVLYLKCLESDIGADVFVGGYNQYAADILADDNALYKFKPRIVVLMIDAQTLLGDMVFDPLSLSAAARRELVQSRGEELLSLIDRLKKKSGAKILVHDLSAPPTSSLGILDGKVEYGLQEAVTQFNARLREALREDSQAFVFDFDALCGRIGKRNAVDWKMYYLGDFKLNFQLFSELAGAYMAYIRPAVGLVRKCLALDLDNTLWGGVLGEDGFEGIKLGPTPEGRSYWEFQKYILGLWRRGVVLAVNSKNNEAEALRVLREHPHSVLKENHFSAIRINWNDKAANLRSIADELSLGLDSFVFIDDDKMNRDLVRQQLPMVRVIDMPEDSARFLPALSSVDDFSQLALTDEDLKRGEMYRQEKSRAVARQAAGNIEDYLKGLELAVTFQAASPQNIKRIAQLIQKTNQFNMTTRRYSEEDIQKLVSDGAHLVFSVSVKDKFGDYGATGAAIVEKSRWIIDAFLLSCRVIGRNVEKAMLQYILAAAKKAGAKSVTGEFIPTARNEIAKDFYKANGFSSVSQSAAKDVWSADPAAAYAAPDYIKVVSA